MNICIFLDSPLDAPGGMVQSALNQKAALERAGHQVYVVCLGKTVIDDPRIMYLSRAFVLINNDVNYAFLFTNKGIYRQVRQFIIEENIQVIHVQTDMTTAMLGVDIGRELKIPVLNTVHNYYWPATGFLRHFGGWIIQCLALYYRHDLLVQSKNGTNQLERTIRAMAEYVCEHTDCVIAPSQHLADDLRGAGVSTPIRVIPNPYDPQITSDPPSLLRVQPANFVWIGRCAPEKRLLEFIAAIRIVRESGRTLNVTIIGDGQDLPEARRRAEDLPVHFTGRLANDEITQHIDAASCLVLTSYHFDNQPVVIAEALSRYRGVLYCDERLKEGVDAAGYLTDAPSSEAIARAMSDIVDDPQIAQDLSRRAQTAAAEFSYDTFVRRFEDAVRSVSGAVI